MASASITVRATKTGRRFVVRYRLGGRAYPIEHGGSFRTMKEARARRDLIAGARSWSGMKIRDRRRPPRGSALQSAHDQSGGS
jgi:hypothetical protein